MELYMYLAIALFFKTTTGKFLCDAPHVATECVRSSWLGGGWKKDQSKFQNKCNGKLVGWGDDDYVDDCGIACFGCSFIKACCDDCTTIKSVTGRWKQLQCVSGPQKVTLVEGIKTVNAGSWSHTSKWVQSVSMWATLSALVKGATGTLGLSASATEELTINTAASWETTRTTETTKEYTQAANTCAWTWITVIVDSCGTHYADSKHFIQTSGPAKGNAPCCLPGYEQSEDGNCPPNNNGDIVNLCPPKDPCKGLIYTKAGSVKKPYNYGWGLTLSQCKEKCLNGEWLNCQGFSRYTEQGPNNLADDVAGVCWWVSEQSQMIPDASTITNEDSWTVTSVCPEKEL